MAKRGNGNTGSWWKGYNGALHFLVVVRARYLFSPRDTGLTPRGSIFNFDTEPDGLEVASGTTICWPG